MVNSIKALQLISMAQPGNGGSPIIKNFRDAFKGILSYRANHCLSRLSQDGQLRLQQLESHLRKSLREPKQFKPGQTLELEDLEIGWRGRLINKTIALCRDLDMSKGVSLEPILEDGRLLLITAADKNEYEIGVQEKKVKVERHHSGILSCMIVGAQEKYRTLAVAEERNVEREEEDTIFTPQEILNMHKAGMMPPIGSWVRIPGLELLVSPYTITNQEIAEWMREGGYKRDKGWSEAGRRWREENRIVQPGFWDDSRFNQLEQPVVGVSWHEAEAYLASKELIFLKEAQWEHVAKGGLNSQEYPWGNQKPTAELAYFGQLWNTGEPIKVTQLFKPNNYGVFHMVGNVWEWCREWYDSNTKVLRGGSWGVNSNDLLRVAYRYNYDPDVRSYYIGFRAARNL